MVNLTTMLAHASGEWIASDWPVCPIAETANPAAHGRRPDLCPPLRPVHAGRHCRRGRPRCARSVPWRPVLRPQRRPSGRQQRLSSRPVSGRVKLTGGPPTGPGMATPGAPCPASPAAASIPSSRRRCVIRLLAETRAAIALGRSRRHLGTDSAPRQERPHRSDAKLVEDAFERRLAELPSPEAVAQASDDAVPRHPDRSHRVADRAGPSSADRCGRPRQRRACRPKSSDRHRQERAGDCRPPPLSQPRPSAVRGAAALPDLRPQAVGPASPSLHAARALGRKASDEFAVPLCRAHHRAVHRAGDERAWWKAAGIDPIKAARKLWKETRVQEGRLRPNQVARANVSDAKKLVSAEQTLPSRTPAAPRQQ